MKYHKQESENSFYKNIKEEKEKIKNLINKPISKLLLKSKAAKIEQSSMSTISNTKRRNSLETQSKHCL